ncbi:hypothetical protein [Leucobacter sp. GX24907]
MNGHTAAEVEGWVAKMRKEIAFEPPAPGTIVTPDQITFELRVLDDKAGKTLWIVKEADKLRADTAELLLRARAKARGAAEGKTAADREAAIDIATEQERAEAEAAQIAYRYAKGMADLVDARKSSLQTQSKLVLASMQLATDPRRA